MCSSHSDSPSVSKEISIKWYVMQPTSILTHLWRWVAEVSWTGFLLNEGTLALLPRLFGLQM